MTLWGESAGAFSIGMHMVANGGDTEGLFRAVFLQSGGPWSVDTIESGERVYVFALFVKTAH